MTAKSKLDPDSRSVVSDDLKLTEDGSVTRASAVASKTAPNLRHETSVDNNKNYEHEFSVFAPRGETLGDEIRERNEVVVRQQAVARGLIPVGDVKLHAEEREGDYVRFVYSVPVKLNVLKSDAPIEPISVSEQPSDAPDGSPEPPVEKPKG